jgi:N-acetylmuramic acid 6-phosphate etherase
MTKQTESLHPDAAGLDARPGPVILDVLLRAQQAAVAAVAPALPAIDRAADLMAETLRGDGRLVYAGAGSSALMANADAMELAGTFGIDPGRILLCTAGGIPTGPRMPGDTEDDADDARRAGEALGPADLVIAVAASGSTPYPLALTRAARGRGARVIAIANNPGAPLFEGADVAVCLPTPPEVIAGSTRMGAGTAQKVALNLMSTLMGVRLGQVHDGMMVGVRADNLKLRARAEAMVAAIAGVDAAPAAAALAAAEGAVKPAVLIALGLSSGRATEILAVSQGNLRAALARVRETGPERHRQDRADMTNQGRR